jgi:hypothetical protein
MVGLAEAWDGGGWSEQQAAPVPAPYSSGELSGISCQSVSACVAVGRAVRQTSHGEAPKPLIERLSSPAALYIARTATPARAM